MSCDIDKKVRARTESPFISESGGTFLDFTFGEVALFYCTVNSSGKQQIDIFASFSSRATPPFGGSYKAKAVVIFGIRTPIIMNPASKGDFNPQNDSTEAATPPNGGMWLQMNLLTLISQLG